MIRNFWWIQLFYYPILPHFWQIFKRGSFSPMVNHLCLFVFHFYCLNITWGLLCWHYSNRLWEGATANETKDLSKRKDIHLMQTQKLSRNGIIIFKATWSMAVRASSVGKIIEFFPKNINCIYIFVNHFLLGHEAWWSHEATMSTRYPSLSQVSDVSDSIRRVHTVTAHAWSFIVPQKKIASP